MCLKKPYKILTGSIILALFLPLGALAHQDISEYEKRLAKLAEQIKKLQTTINKDEKKETSVLSRLDRIGLNKRLIRKEILLCNTRLEKSNKELSSIKQSISQLKKNWKEKGNLLRRYSLQCTSLANSAFSNPYSKPKIWEPLSLKIST